ncbi:MAG TPA: DUF1501 domain-containing protein [Planctomycetaceae bacterium]|nr:DUF1501 domain-containing protein [Planctomycetaceae bacterium]
MQRTHDSRRDWLRRSSTGFGLLALQGLLADSVRAGGNPRPHHAPKAKSVIFFFMDGGPSHVDTFDPKPALKTHQGKAIGASAVSKRSQSTANRVWMGSPWEFRPRGQSGLPVSDLLPHIASVADDLCVVRSMIGEQPLHGQQNLLLHTGRVTGGHPSFGSWASYGLGTEAENLPGYVVLNNDWVPNGGLENFASAYLPAVHQATSLRAKGIPLDNIRPSDRDSIQRRKLAMLRDQDGAYAGSAGDRDAIEAAIRNYETAFQMQAAVPLIADVSRESDKTRAMYGLDAKNDYQKYYALQCLRARRLIEAGVRFVEVTCPLTHANNSPWDQHGQIKKYHTENALITDQAVGALIKDLKQRGLFETTVVVWAGEMGRTPHTPAISENAGRDHHVNGYSLFVAGGGFKGGITYGATDDFGNSVAEKPLTVHDIHATILHQLGIDHERLTFRFGGRDQRLTDVHGKVVKELLA